MCIYIYTYVYIDIDIDMYMYIYIYTHVHIYIYIWMNICYHLLLIFVDEGIRASKRPEEKHDKTRQPGAFASTAACRPFGSRAPAMGDSEHSWHCRSCASWGAVLRFSSRLGAQENEYAPGDSTDSFGESAFSIGKSSIDGPYFPYPREISGGYIPKWCNVTSESSEIWWTLELRSMRWNELHSFSQPTVCGCVFIYIQLSIGIESRLITSNHES